MLDKDHVAAGAAWLGLPAGLALSSSLGVGAGHLAAPAVWSVLSRVPLLDPAPAAVAASVIATASTLAPLALLPAVRLLQRSGSVPRWAAAPVGLSVAIAGSASYVHALRALLLSGTALPVAIEHVGFGGIAGVMAAMAAGAMASIPVRRRGRGAKVRRDPNGAWRADWWPMREARKAMSDKSGLILGEACVPADEPDQVGRASLLRWTPDGHLLTVAGSGAGKGVSVVVPNCLGWAGPVVVHDPAGETLAVVRAHRQRMGRTVRVVSLGDDTDGVNVLEWLDPTSKTFAVDVRSVVSWLDAKEEGSRPDDDSFSGLARTLCIALIEFVVTSPTIPDHDRHLGKVRELGASPNLRNLLMTMIRQRDVGRGDMANCAGFVHTTMNSKETYAGVNMHFETLTACINGMEEILCGAVAPKKRFALADILTGNTDFFICLPPDVLDAMPQVPRILIGALSMMFARQNVRAVHETLFIVDEMPRLGRLQALATARDIARKYGLYVWAIVQDLGQLEAAYQKTGVRSWLATPAVLQLFAVNDIETAEMAVKRCGKYTAVTESSSRSRGRSSGSGAGSTSTNRSDTTQATAADLITIDDVMTLAVDERGKPIEQLLFVRGRRPLRCGLPRYFQRKEMAGLVRDNPFYRPSQRQRLDWRPVMAGVWGLAMLGLAGITAMVPLPWVAGDEAVIVGRRMLPLFSSTDGRQIATVPPGWRVRVMSLSERADGFVEVTGYAPHGALSGLVDSDYIDRPKTKNSHLELY